jgi:polyhydroxybutyrate depolymerase
MKPSALIFIACVTGATACSKQSMAASDTGSGDAATGSGGASGSGGTTGTGGMHEASGSGGSPIVARGATDAGHANRVADSSTDAGASGDAGTPPTRASAGCGKPRPNQDSSTEFIRHDVSVTGVDPAFITDHPASGGSWTDRSYYVRLPDGYDASKPYPLSIGGGGCGNTDGTSGSGGGLAALPSGQNVAIQVGLNYMYPQNAGACFADDYINTPDLPYFDAVLAALETDYCVDSGKVFVDGFSSGAWEAYLLGCARAGVVRGIGTAEGGLRMTRPPCTQSKVAAILVAGLSDTENPIGPLDPPGKNDSLGSAPARDDILMRNGCVGRDTEAWDASYPGCVKYTGCPDAYPVVWCAIDAGHGDGGDISRTGFWKFWSSLPER